MIQSLRQKLLDRFVLRPSRSRLPYAPKERLTLSRNGDSDELFLSRPRVGEGSSCSDKHGERPPELVVFKFPGTAGRAERASDWPSNCLPQLDIQLCSWNAPGYGRTSGRASLARLPRRAAAMFESMCDKMMSAESSWQDTSIWLVGNSLGCATAVWVANQFGDRVGGLILRNPPPLVQTVKRVAHRYPAGRWTDPIAESLPPTMDLTQTARQISQPTVILQSEYDRLVPPELQMQVFDAIKAPKRLVVMEGLGHDGVATERHEQDIDDAVRWLWDQTKSS